MLTAARNLQPELMDEPGLDEQTHQQALRGLARLNRWSNSAGILWKPIQRLATEKEAGPLRVLDVASGAGDVAIALSRRASGAGVGLEITGCDISPTAVGHAARSAKAKQADVRFEQRDILDDPPTEAYDIVTCSLFLHHLPQPQAVALLRSMGSIAGRLLLVNDLARSLPGYALAQVACRTLSRSPIVHVDGPRSVEGAFTLAEARQLCRDAGLEGATVTARWPCRFLLQWRPSRGESSLC